MSKTSRFFQIWSRTHALQMIQNVPGFQMFGYMLSTQLQFVLTKGKELAAFSVVLNDLQFTVYR